MHRKRILLLKMRNPASRKIAVVYPASVPWISRCLDGIRRYGNEHGNWHLLTSPPTLRGAEELALTLSSLAGWKGDAIIAVSNDADELRAVRRMKIPVINLAGGLPQSFGIPRVIVDNFEAGRLAAGHFLDRGLRHLAFFGWENVWYSDQRRQGFEARAAEENVPCRSFVRSYEEEVNQTWVQRIAGPAAWLASLPRPVGVFAAHDYRAQLLIGSSSA